VVEQEEKPMRARLVVTLVALAAPGAAKADVVTDWDRDGRSD
jgi:hypothetical protein